MNVAGHGNGPSYTYRMIRNTFWVLVAIDLVVMLFGAISNYIKYHEVPYWVGAMFWISLGVFAVIMAIRALFNQS